MPPRKLLTPTIALLFPILSLAQLHTDAVGNIGIGTNVPQKKLDVVGGVRIGEGGHEYAEFNFQVGDILQTGYNDIWPDRYERAFMIKPRGYLDWAAAGGSGIQFYTYDAVAGTSGNYTGGYRRAMVIRKNGNVGIGTVNPIERLSINGNLNLDGNYPNLRISRRLILQVPTDGDNNYTRSYLSQNLKWNETTGKWTVPDHMYTDFAMMRYENSGSIGFYTAESMSNLEISNNNLSGYLRLGIDGKGNVGVANHLGVGGNVGIGNGATLNGLNNGGVHIMKGAHSSLVLGEPQQGYGGFVQTSDARHRLFLGANLFDDQSLGWRSLTPSKGAAGISLVADEGDWGTVIGFYLSQDGSIKERMSLFGNGIVSIGATNGYSSYNITNTDYKLYVETGIRTRKVRVDQASWADHVFEPTYKLPTLQEVEAFIKQHKHLPDVPSAKEVEANGLDLGENQVVLLKKIEEQMLYILELNKRLEKLEAANKQLEQQNSLLQNTTPSK